MNTFGLTPSQFFDTLSDTDRRRFLDPQMVPVLDALFSGRLAGENLRRVLMTLVDLDSLIATAEGRRLILDLFPDHKRSELEDRVERSVKAADSGTWTSTELKRLRDFFGLVDEDFSPAQKSISTETIVPKYGLFDHQRKAVAKTLPLLAGDERRVVLHLPTGVGKTRTAMHIVAEFLRVHDPSVVVWLASGKELLEQAEAAFEEAWSHLGNRSVQIGAMWGDNTPDLDRFSDGLLAVSLAKGWAMLSGGDTDWAARISRRVRLVVFDEAHQSIAPTYRRITDELTLDYRCALLGLTATPGRSWADIDQDGELARFFADQKVNLEVPGDDPIAYLIEEGYLAQPKFRTLLAEPGVDVSAGDLARIARSLDIPGEIVSALSMSEQYMAAVLQGTEELLEAGHQRVLVFAASVAHAKLLTAVLLARGVHAEAVTGATPKRIRDRAIRDFKKDGETPMILVNFGVLTTGFDAPRVTATLIARPTKSLVLYSQMVGRAIRGPKAGGTKNCEVVTVIDPSLPGFGDVAEAFLNWEDVWS